MKLDTLNHGFLFKTWNDTQMDKTWLQCSVVSFKRTFVLWSIRSQISFMSYKLSHFDIFILFTTGTSAVNRSKLMGYIFNADYSKKLTTIYEQTGQRKF